jgi:hypothetical protein
MKRLQLAICLPLLVFLFGCPNLSQVQQFAKTSDAAKTSITAIAADFKGTCDRQNLYVHLLPGPPPSPPPQKACVNGDDLEKLGNNLIVEQNVLLQYINTLGNLAGTDAVGFEKEAPKLDTNFKTAGFNTTQQSMAASAGTLASYITKMATLEYRKRKILEILRGADPAITKLTTGLANQVATASDVEDTGGTSQPGTSYFQLLSNEKDLLDSYYQVPLATDPSSSAGTLLNDQYHNARGQLKARQDAAKAYRKLMISIGQAHNKLLTGAESGNFNRESVEKIAKDLAQPISDMTSAITTLEKDSR